MLKRLIIINLIFISFFLSTISFSDENKIIVKIENEIITSIDINNEYKYLIALNPNLKKAKKKDIIKLSKKSTIQEKIKMIEIEKNFNKPQIPQKLIEQILKNVYSRIGFSNLKDFKSYLINNDVDFENVKKKLEIEALWNELILIKFSSRIKINKKELKERIKINNKLLKSYLLSEISFEVKNLNELENKFRAISKIINDKGFNFAALEYSISQTSNLGGKLDWINENSLNKNIKKALNNLKINDFTKPINIGGGFLILQINDIKYTKVEINVDKELRKLEIYEKNNQLNQYSKIYFNKVKKDLEINEF